MTPTETQQAQAGPDAQASSAPRGNKWAPTFRGVALATRIELVRRRPSVKGWIFYGVALGLMILLSIAVSASAGDGNTEIPLELNVLMVLGIGILVSTSLAATSVNGDSSDGVLAPLQMTRLTAGDIAFGKLLASWLASIAALITLLPFLLYAYSRSTWQFGEFATVVGAILFVVLASTAIGLAWSSIAARAIASVSLAHITVGSLMVGTVVLFFVVQPLVQQQVEVTNHYPDWSQITDEQANDPDFQHWDLPCVAETHRTTISHNNRIAGLLLINPFVMVSETAPLMDEEAAMQGGDSLFGLVHMGMGGMQTPVDVSNLGYNDCDQSSYDRWAQENVENSQYPRNPWVGLAFNGALLVGSMWITVNRLRVPYRKLRGGTRVA